MKKMTREIIHYVMVTLSVFLSYYIASKLGIMKLLDGGWLSKVGGYLAFFVIVFVLIFIVDKIAHKTMRLN